MSEKQNTESLKKTQPEFSYLVIALGVVLLGEHI